MILFTTLQANNDSTYTYCKGRSEKIVTVYWASNEPAGTEGGSSNASVGGTTIVTRTVGPLLANSHKIRWGQL